MKVEGKEKNANRGLGKTSKSTTFYKLLQEGGYIKESFDVSKERKRPWHVKKLKLNSDFNSDSD